MKQTIKLLLAMCLLISLNTIVLAQAPQKFNYQGIARDTKGNPIAKQKMNLKISVLPTSDATVAEYEETQSITTNEFGLYTLQIGNGTPISGEMKTVKWETGNKYIKVSIDQNGGNNYVDMGTSQLLSVPYAIYADKAGLARETVSGTEKTRTGAVNSSASHVAGDANFIPKFTGLNVIGKSSIYDNGNVGIGTSTPSAKLQVAGSAATPTELRIQHTNTAGAARLSFKNDALPGFSVGSDFAIMNKFASGSTGTVAAGYPASRLFAFNNSMGNLLFTSNGSVGFGNYDITASPQFVVRMHIDSATGNIGVGTVVPTRKFHVNNTSPSYNAMKITNTTTGATATDGLELGLSNSEGYVWNWENGPIHLGTNNSFRMSVLGNGNVGVGTAAPNDKFQVIGGITTGDNATQQGRVSLLPTNGSAFFHMLNNNDNTLRFSHGASAGANDIMTFNVSNSINKVGIGTSTPAARLQVPAAADTAILGTFTSSGGVGVYGSAAGGGFGAGVVGRAFGGAGTIPTSRDIGVYGASGDVAVWSQGKLKVVDGSEGAGKVLVSDATGTATWRAGSTYTSIVPNQRTGSLTATFTKIGADLGTFTKLDGSSKIEINFNTFLQFSSTTGTGVAFELRIDDLPTTLGNIRALLRTAGETDDVNMSGVFPNLTAGTHTISLWGRATASGTATGAGCDIGNFSTSSIIVKETY